MTWIGELPIGQSPNLTVRVDVADPPEDTVTVVLLKLAESPPLSRSVSETLPENPPVLVTLIVVLYLESALQGLHRLDGFAVIVKSPVAWAGTSDGSKVSAPRSRTKGIILIFMFCLRCLLHGVVLSHRARLLWIFERGGRYYPGKVIEARTSLRSFITLYPLRGQTI